MDIDIDLPTTFNPTQTFDCATQASRIHNNKLTHHVCGVYFQNIPKDPITSLSAIPFKEAEELGYFKIDFLHLSILDHFTNKQEMRELLKKEPNWSLLDDPNVISKLFQLSNWPIVFEVIKPRSIEDLADCLAIIRPKKQHLLHTYDRNTTRKELYTIIPGDKTSFKRSHALAYAMNIVLQLHLIEQEKL